MGNRRFYEVLILDVIGDGLRQIRKVLFYWDDIEFWAEPEAQRELMDVFRRSYHETNPDIVQIVPVDLGYFYCVVGTVELEKQEVKK